MLIKKGIPVSPGVAISRAVVLDAEDQPVPKRAVPESQVPEELQRLDRALAATARDLENLRTKAEAVVGSELAGIFGSHIGMLKDKHLTGQFRHLIEAERITAEYAVYTVMRGWAEAFRQQDNRYFRDRTADIWDLERQVLSHLIGRKRAELSHLRSQAVVIAHDLTPSQTAAMDRKKILGIATDAGGRTGHTAILAHALGIPSIVGLEDLTSHVNTGDTVIVDGNNGVVIVDPDADKLMSYREELRRMTELRTWFDKVAHLPAQTTDGTQINILANIEFPSEIDAAIQKGASGIGLYRTEFLFLAATEEPTEEHQYATYRKAIRALGGRPLTIRTLDLGADKIVSLGGGGDQSSERNPFLGCRSIRLCLQNLPLFKTQLHAILRASTEGPVRIMFPLISSITELRQAKMILNDVREDLDEEGVPYGSDIPVGVMIEVPSAALQATTLAREVDFFSIGTNDLIQYTLAVDRSNERIASLYSAAHPSVIQLMRNVIRAGNRANIDVSLCGEVAGEPEFVMLLIGLGLRSLSITPPAIPEIKKIIRSVSIDQCRRVARRVAGFDSDREIHNYLRDELSRVVPEAVDGRNVEV
jgi:phosphotransferase system enzyme I (PtsI)